MRIAIISDVHANLPAFEAVLGDIEKSGCEAVWCLGDLVGYGAEPEACVQLARSTCEVCLAGNHDLAVTGAIALADFSGVARRAAEWTVENLSAEALSYLRSLQPAARELVVGLYHGSPRDPVWEYLLSPLQAELSLDVQPHRVCLVGHSHVALSFSRTEPGSATGETRAGGEILQVSEGEWLINPGSVGQPRDGDPRAAWLELDLGDWSASYHRVPYDVAAAALAIRAAKLPDSLAERLRHGQ